VKVGMAGLWQARMQGKMAEDAGRLANAEVTVNPVLVWYRCDDRPGMTVKTRFAGHSLMSGRDKENSSRPDLRLAFQRTPCARLETSNKEKWPA